MRLSTSRSGSLAWAFPADQQTVPIDNAPYQASSEVIRPAAKPISLELSETVGQPVSPLPFFTPEGSLADVENFEVLLGPSASYSFCAHDRKTGIGVVVFDETRSGSAEPQHNLHALNVCAPPGAEHVGANQSL
jgi:hypothetical protein